MKKWTNFAKITVPSDVTTKKLTHVGLKDEMSRSKSQHIFSVRLCLTSTVRMWEQQSLRWIRWLNCFTITS